MEKEIRIDGEIGGYGNSSEEFNYRLSELDLQSEDELLVKISSPGGSVIEGWGIYNTLRGLENKVTTRGEGLVASISALILMAGEVREMSEIGSLMIHRASNHVHGNAEDLAKAAEVLKTIDSTQLTVFNGITNDDVSEEMVNEWLENETWFLAEAAKAHGFVHAIVNKVETSVAAIYKPKQGNIMSLSEDIKNLVNKISGITAEAEPKAEEVKEEPKEEVVEEAAEEQKPEAVTAEQMAELIEALSKINERLNAIENPEKSVDEVVENKIRLLLKGVKSAGAAPVANGNLNGNAGDPAYQPKHAGLMEKLAEIDEKTRETSKY
jgi:ATP-dependent protease ClpP protease subunit